MTYKRALFAIDLGKVRLFGFRYVVDYMAYLKVQQSREEAYQVYCTDALKAVVRNTANLAGGETMRMRFADIISSKPVDNRSSDEIIDDLKSKISMLGGEDENELC